MVLADVSYWITLAVAVVGLLFGAVLGGVGTIADRWQAGRTRRGDLAAVGIRHRQWQLGTKRVPLIQTDSGDWVDSQPSIDFPMTVTNGSGEKVTSVEFGIRWKHDNRETVAGFSAVVLPGEQEEGIAQEEYNEDTFEPWFFEHEWLDQLDFFVRFTDQRGQRHENVLKHRPKSSWASTPISDEHAASSTKAPNATTEQG